MSLRIIGVLFLLACCFLSCTQKNDEKWIEDSIEEIKSIHQEAFNHPLDAHYFKLKNAERLIQSVGIAPDSIKAENDYLLGVYFAREGKMDSVMAYFHNATEHIQNQNRINSKRQVEYFYKTWSTYLSQDQFGNCITVSERFRRLLDKDKDFKWLAWAYYFDANLYLKRQVPDYDKAMENNQLRIEMLKKAKDTLNLIPALNTQARIKYMHLKDAKGAFQILDDLLDSQQQLSYDFKRQLYGNYAIFLYYEGKYEAALEYYLKELNSIKKTPDTFDKENSLATVYVNIADVYIELEELEKAQAYIDSVKTLDINRIGYEKQKTVLRHQFRISALINNKTTEVFNYLDRILKYQEIHYTTKMNSELVDLQKANEKEKILLANNRNAEIKHIKLQSRLFSLLVFLSFLMMTGFLFYQQRKFKFEKENLQMQQRLMRSQMNPHFTFNILTAIRNLMRKDQGAADRYLVKFSRLLRLILDNSMLNYVPLENELESLKKYMDLQLLRFPRKFNYQIDLGNLEGDDFVFIPPMLIQPFIENCIEHGFYNINYTGEINLCLSQENQKMIRCIIEDNGNGLTVQRNEEKESVSTQLIADFLEKMGKVKIEVINKNEFDPNEKGVVVSFLIPFKNNKDG